MTQNIMNVSSQKLALCLTVIFCSLSACGPKSFQGLLAPAPEWVFVDLLKWDQREVVMGGKVNLYGRGKSEGQTLITNRRAIAERKAVQHAKTRFMALYKRYLAAASHSTLYLNLTSELPWEQIALNSERYFDAKKNTQYVLVAISEDRLMSAILFEQSADLKRSELWSSIAKDLRYFYQTIRSSSESSDFSPSPSTL